MDRVTGKAKGFGFDQFNYRKGANKALKEPKKRIWNRIAICQLASLVNGGMGRENIGRKVYVNNVGHEVDSKRLRVFFERFGEMDTLRNSLGDGLKSKKYLVIRLYFPPRCIQPEDIGYLKLLQSLRRKDTGRMPCTSNYQTKNHPSVHVHKLHRLEIVTYSESRWPKAFSC